MQQQVELHKWWKIGNNKNNKNAVSAKRSFPVVVNPTFSLTVNPTFAVTVNTIFL